MIHVARSALWVGHYTETRVEYSYYLLQIQLHDPTVKVPCLINHRKQSTDVVWTTLLESLLPPSSVFGNSNQDEMYYFVWWTDNNPLLNINNTKELMSWCVIFIFNYIYFGIPKQMDEAIGILCNVLTDASTYSVSPAIIIHPWAVVSLMTQTTSTT